MITLLLGELTRQDRQKIMTICTIDVHSRDVVGRLIQSKIENVLAFQWQSQLRHRQVYDILKDTDRYKNRCTQCIIKKPMTLFSTKKLSSFDKITLW